MVRLGERAIASPTKGAREPRIGFGEQFRLVP